jgi:hypothetical protein
MVRDGEELMRPGGATPHANGEANRRDEGWEVAPEPMRQGAAQFAAAGQGAPAREEDS